MVGSMPQSEPVPPHHHAGNGSERRSEEHTEQAAYSSSDQQAADFTSRDQHDDDYDWMQFHAVADQQRHDELAFGKVQEREKTQYGQGGGRPFRHEGQDNNGNAADNRPDNGNGPRHARQYAQYKRVLHP